MRTVYHILPRMVGSLLLAAALLRGAEPPQARYREAQRLSRAQDFPAAAALLTELLGEAQLPALLEFDAVQQLAANHVRQNQRDAAHALYPRLQSVYAEKIYPSAEVHQADKLSYGLQVLQSYLAGSDYAGGEALLGRLRALPELGRKELLQLQTARAGLEVSRGEAEQAAALHREALGWEGMSVPELLGVYRQLAGLYQRQMRNPDRMREVLVEMVRLGARDAGCKGLLKALAGFKAPQSFYNNPGNVEFAWESFLQMENVGVAERGEALAGLCEAKVQLGKRGEALALARQLQADEEQSGLLRCQGALMALGLAAAPGSAPAAEALAAVLAEVSGLSPADRFKAMNEAAAVLKYLPEGELARQLQRQAAALVPEPAKVHLCRYLPELAANGSVWMARLQDAGWWTGDFLDYNTDHAKGLEADVAAERSTGTGSAAEKEYYARNTEFAMSYDLEGWHIFVRCGEKELAEKRLRGGSLGALEFFFAPGPERPYAQWIVSLGDGQTDYYDWNSPHRHFRGQSGYARSETVYAGDQIATHVFFPWDMLYDVLPFESGEEWLFQLVRWSPAGGLAWTGGKVHATGDFGRVEWQPPAPEFLTALRHRLLIRAWERYQQSYRAEITEKWASRDFGDPVFLRDWLQPEIDRLNGYGKVLEGLTADQPEAVLNLWQTARQDWMNFGYLCAEQRRLYLETTLTGDGR